MENKILIVDSNYYPEVSVNLVQGALEYLNNHKIKSVVIKAPGAFEIPFLINIKKDFFDGFIALGCIIRGETYHFEIISNEVARKIMDLSININKPIGFGILTCENFDQALERADPNKGNKGAEAAKACVDLLNLR
tara:strand:+ start:411 stop:818 length:408 start_codon:yes stop_codon:yes gene_type:complete